MGIKPKLSNEYLIYVLDRLVQKHGLPISRTGIKSTLTTHSYYPSILSISDAFKSWHVDHAPLKIQVKDIQHLEEVPKPFLAFILNMGGQFVTIEEITTDEVTYYSYYEGLTQVSIEEFQTIWEGVILVIFPEKKSGEENYFSQIIKERLFFFVIPILSLAFIFLILYSISQVFTLMGGSVVITFIVLKTAGLVLSAMIFARELGQKKSIIDDICQTTNTDCERVLSSNESKLLGVIPWENMGIIYFLGGLIFLLIPLNNLGGSLSLLFGLNILTVGFSLYSIYYQRFIVKEWCIFCLLTVFIFLMEFLTLYINFDLIILNELTLLTFKNAILAFFLPTTILLLGQPIIDSSKNISTLQLKLHRLKFNQEVFSALAKRGKPLPDLAKVKTLNLGNQHALNKFTIITNPTCGPCKRAHRMLQEYIDHFSENISIQIIFVVGDSIKEKKYIAAKHMMGIYLQEKENKILEAMDEWFDYGISDLQQWIEKFGTGYNANVIENILLDHQNWCQEHSVNYTPMIFFNGHELPKDYDISDLKYFLKDSSQQNTTPNTL